MTTIAESTAPQQAPTGLTIQDLTLTLQVIQVASSRGAFKADELTAIGGLYDRIFKFLESTGAITTTPAPNASATPTATVTETPAANTKPAAKAAAKKTKGK
jgi:hypothetical protein